LLPGLKQIAKGVGGGTQGSQHLKGRRGEKHFGRKEEYVWPEGLEERFGDHKGDWGLSFVKFQG